MASHVHATNSVIFSYPGAKVPGLKLVAKCYEPLTKPDSGLTLLLTHCTGSHKEVWEPVIESLFERNTETADYIRIRRIWSVDWQSHGEAGILNEAILSASSDGLSVHEYAAGLRAFIASDHVGGQDLVGIGHSAGATAILLATIAAERTAFTTIILVEPALLTRAEYIRHIAEGEAALAFVHRSIDRRRDIWNDRLDAKQYFKQKLPWKLWDDRVLDLYTSCGLMDVSVEEEGHVDNKVTLVCTRLQERKSYVDNEPHFMAVERLETLDQHIPVHCIFGDRVDVVPKYAHDSILLVRQMSSTQFVPRAGHFVVQENPVGVATALIHILRSSKGLHSKL